MQHLCATVTAAGSRFTIPQVILLLVAAVAVWWYAVKVYRKSEVTPFMWPLLLYLCGVVSIATALFPEAGSTPEAPAGGVGDRTHHLVFAAVAVGIGAVVHVVLVVSRKGRSKPEGRKLLAIGVAVVPMAFLVAYLESRDLGHWMAYATAGGLVLVVLLIGLIVLMIWLGPENRMARCMRAEEFRKAMEIGEAIPEAERSVGVRINLAGSLFLAGRAEEARSRLDALSAMPDVPEQIKPAIDDWRVKVDKAIAEKRSGAVRDEGRASGPGA